MTDNNVLLLKAGDVHQLLDGREDDVIDAVRQAYEIHTRGASAMPSAPFLRFPGGGPDRIICKQAYLGESFNVAGMKWVASVPDNVPRGIPRASAVIVLNARETGRPTALLEGSIISARRTAASAALAARELRQGQKTSSIGFVGCGLINFETARFLAAVYPNPDRVAVYDLDPGRAADFAKRLEEFFGSATAVANLDDLQTDVTSFATTAVVPHVDELSFCPSDGTVLHISLRDLTPKVILGHDNVVDDYEHVNQAQTSIHLASEEAGNGDFCRGSIGEVLLGQAPAKEGNGVTIFSPFGLGVLDLAVAELVRAMAEKEGVGTVVESFLP